MNTKKFINFRYIFYPFLIFLFGIYMARGLYAGVVENLVITLILLISLGSILIYKKKYKILTILFAFFFLGNGFYFLGEHRYKVKDYLGVVSVVGRVSDRFEEGEHSYTIVLDDVSIAGENAKNIELYISKDSNARDLEVGDILAFESEVEVMPLFSLSSLNSSIARQDIGYSASVKQSELIITKGYKKFDETIRLAVKNLLYEKMSEGNAGIAYAVLFGDKSGIAYEVNEAYRNSGIIHILTVSGLHVGFLISLIYGFLKLCKANKYLNFSLTTLIIFIYAYLCGFAPSVVRAAVMGVVIMLAKLCGRRYDTLNALGLSGFIILIVSPITAFDIGFLMSLACVCGIVLLYPLFYNFLRKFTPNIVAQYIAVSLSAQLAILPFLATFFSNYNCLSFIINLLIVPLFSVLYPYLFVVSIICLIMPFMSFLFVIADYGFTAINFMSSIFANTVLQFILSPMKLAVIVFFFILLYILGQFLMVKPVNRFLLSTVAVLCMTFSFGFSSVMSSVDKGAFYLNSYGQESVLLVNSSGQTMLVGDNFIVKRCMKQYNIDKLDYFVALDDLAAEDVHDLEDYGFSYYICIEGDNAKEEITIVSPSQTIVAGDFVLNYIVYQDKLLGVNINFDDVDVFVANDVDLNYNITSGYQYFFSIYSPDIVFASDNYQLAELGDFICVSSKNNDMTDYNYSLDGNLLFDFKDYGFKVRRID